MSEHFGFVQIAAASSGLDDGSAALFALDRSGKVWLYRGDSDDWIQLGVGRAPFIGPGIERQSYEVSVPAPQEP